MQSGLAPGLLERLWPGGRSGTSMPQLHVELEAQAPGPHLVMVGSHRALGWWDPGRGVQLHWTGSLWEASSPIDLPGASSMGYKFVRIRHGTPEWEAGPNRALDVPEGDPSEHQLVATFNGEAALQRLPPRQDQHRGAAVAEQDAEYWQERCGELAKCLAEAQASAAAEVHRFCEEEREAAKVEAALLSELAGARGLLAERRRCASCQAVPERLVRATAQNPAGGTIEGSQHHGAGKSHAAAETTVDTDLPPTSEDSSSLSVPDAHATQAPAGHHVAGALAVQHPTVPSSCKWTSPATRSRSETDVSLGRALSSKAEEASSTRPALARAAATAAATVAVSDGHGRAASARGTPAALTPREARLHASDVPTLEGGSGRWPLEAPASAARRLIVRRGAKGFSPAPRSGRASQGSDLGMVMKLLLATARRQRHVDPEGCGGAKTSDATSGFESCDCGGQLLASADLATRQGRPAFVGAGSGSVGSSCPGTPDRSSTGTTGAWPEGPGSAVTTNRGPCPALSLTPLGQATLAVCSRAPPRASPLSRDGGPRLSRGRAELSLPAARLPEASSQGTGSVVAAALESGSPGTSATAAALRVASQPNMMLQQPEGLGQAREVYSHLCRIPLTA